jgi:anaerobic magnesium-protoporphyrin IX monomethyl ester cyclase
LKFLLINPPIRQSGPPKHYPLGLCLLAAILDQAGYEVALLDANAYRLNREQVRIEAKTSLPEGADTWDLVGIGNLISTYGWQKEVIQALKRDWPRAKIVAGGGCATALGAQMLEWIPELDAVCVGEGEKTIKRIAEQEADFRDIKGVSYRDEAGGIQINPPVELLTEQEFDELPFPKWELAFSAMPDGSPSVYFKNSSLALSKESYFCTRRIDIEATRGCPYICNFCTDVMTGNSRTGYQYREKFRVHSPKYVAEMMARARFKLGIDFVLFVDENFDTNRAWVAQMCDALEEYDLPSVVKWGATAHVNTVSLELLARMRECGCAYLDFGMESGSDTILRYIKKNATRERNQRALDWALKVGINPLCNFMMGQPIETVQTVYDTASFLVKNGILVKPFFATPYPATELYYTQMEKLLKKHGSLEKFMLSLGDATDLAVNLTQFKDRELIALRELVAMHDMNGILEFAKERGERIVNPDTGRELVAGETAEAGKPVPLPQLRMLEDRDYGMKTEWISEIQARVNRP